MSGPERRVELLAPAKDLAGGKDAVSCGADAVYIGAPEFGCRRAYNPVADIGRLADHAHRWGVKVYAAVNTILNDEELERATVMIRELWNAGVDAAIVADMGLLEADLPPIPLIASVQAHCATPAKARFLEKAGFSRVTLSRELTLAEVREIRAATTVELECFVHGSVGVAQEGRCYWNWALGGPVGNRCDADKPCREAYTLRDARGRTLARDRAVLSMKDLDLSERLGDLLDAGVASLKIEGRQKGLDYARNVVAAYRRALDAVLPARGLRPASCGRAELPFAPDLAKAPSRGRTAYFLDGRRETLTAAPDAAAARPPDAAFLRALRRPLPERRVGVRLSLTEKGRVFELRAVDEEGRSAVRRVAEAKGAGPGPEQALARLTEREAARFRLDASDARLPGPRRPALRALTAARRAALDELEARRLKVRPRRGVRRTPNAVPYPERELDYRSNVLNAKARRFYERHGARVAEGAVETGADPTGRPLMDMRFCVRHELGLCPRAPRRPLSDAAPGPLFMEDRAGRKYRLEFDCAACRMSLTSGDS